MCPHCEKPLYGSASRGKLGKYYAAYHCNRSHYFRVPVDEFNEKVTNYVKSIKIAPEYIEALTSTVIAEWQRREAEVIQDDQSVNSRIAQLTAEARLTVDKMKYLSSETAIKYMEEDLLKIEAQIAELKTQKDEVSNDNNSANMEVVMKYIEYFLEHLEYLLLQQMNPLAKAGYFGVLFDKAPTYNEIAGLGTHNLTAALELNELFRAKNDDSGHLAEGVGFEPTEPLQAQ